MDISRKYKKINFEQIEKEMKMILRKEIKEYLTSYEFLELIGFLDGKLVCFNAINDVKQNIEKIVLQQKYLKEIEKKCRCKGL